MKIDSAVKVKELLDTVDKCHGDVYLKSIHGDCYNLKSQLSKYVAMAALIEDKAGELELFCKLKEDEHFFFELFNIDPEIL